VTCKWSEDGRNSPATNHISDPWPSIIGTAVHAWLEKAFTADNPPTGLPRWVVEQRVVPMAGHAGTADLYDVREQAVVDHKVLGPTSMDAVMAPGGPPRKYQIQLLLYGRGYRNLGLPVKRVVVGSIPAYPGDVEGVVCVGACIRLRGRRACGQCAGGHGASGADRGRSAVRTAFTMDTSRTRPKLWRLLLLSVLPSTCN